MKTGWLIIILLPLFFISCTGEEAKANFIERDTTITPANSFSDLFLDSVRVENFIQQQKVKDSAAKQIRNFYNSRNYQFAWFTDEGLAEQARAFWNLHKNYVKLSKDSSLFHKQLHQQIDTLLSEEENPALTKEAITTTELQLTQHFFEFAHYAYAGRMEPEELQWYIPRKKLDAVALLDSLITYKGKNLQDWEPLNQQYSLMNKALIQLYDLQKNSSWETIDLGGHKVLKMGDSATVVQQIKQRLMALGDMDGGDTSEVFTTTLNHAVKRAQKRFGLKQDGVIGPATLKTLNTPLEQRIEQLLVNMERMRWMPEEAEGRHIIANIPEFKLHVYEGADHVFEMDIVVGKAGNKTVVFNDELKYVVFSPYWNVPASIVRNEIWPAMQKNSNYLARNNMEQTGVNNGLPVIRQKPGGSNALGRVKFIFPNSYNIYFHDTPAKTLFERENRAFSHGCIRLAEPQKMAAYLLQNKPEWTTAKISEAMYAGTEKWVTLDKAIPVFISYFTAWVDRDGLLNFREDIYGHDTKMAKRMFRHSEH